jgi:hypothetical protein
MTTKAGRLLVSAPRPFSAENVRFTKDRKMIVAAVEGAVHVWQLPAGTQVGRFPLSSGTINTGYVVALNNEGIRLALRNEHSTKRAWSFDTGRSLLRPPETASGLWLSRDGEYCGAIGGDDRERFVKVYRLADGAEIFSLASVGESAGLQLADRARLVALVSRKENAIYNPHTSKRVCNLEGDFSHSRTSHSTAPGASWRRHRGRTATYVCTTPLPASSWPCSRAGTRTPLPESISARRENG